MKRAALALGCVLALSLSGMSTLSAVELKVLTAGAFKHFPIAMAPEFEKQTGHKVTIENDTVGGLVRRITGGEVFDVAFVSPSAVDILTGAGKLVPGPKVLIGRIGIGLVVKDGAPKPAVDTVQAFKLALLEAKSISFPDPASGGSAGVYTAQLIQRLGLAEKVGPKTKLVPGDVRLIDPVVRGEVELGIYPVAEIMATQGVSLVGPFPPEIQNSTTYAVAVGTASAQSDAAKAFVTFVSGPAAAPVLAAKGIDPPAR